MHDEFQELLPPSANDIGEANSMQDQLRESEAKYRALLTGMDEGYLLGDVIFDEAGRAIDVAFVEGNPAAARLTGLDLTGNRLSEVRNFEPFWYEIWGRVARTGEGERHERYAASLGRWYDFSVFKLHPEKAESRRLAVIFRDITARKRTDTALRQSEERIQLATEAAGLGIFDVDLVTLDMEWDARQRALWGVGADEVITDEIFIAGVHSEDREFVRAAVARALDPDGHRLYAAEYRVLPLNGLGERWIAATARVHFEGRQPVRLVGTVQDITARKRTEAALRESEERLHLATAAAGLGIFDADLITGERDWGARLRDLWGVGADEVITHEIFMAGVHPEDREGVEAALEHAHDPDSDHLYTAEYRVLPLDGTDERWIAATGRMHFAGRQPARLIGTMQDITARRRTERALYQSEERLQLATEAAGLGILDVNLTSGEIGWDMRLRELWGVGADQVITDETFIAGIHPEDHETARAAVERALDPDGKGLYAAEYRLLPLDGSDERWIAATGRVHFEGRQPVRLVGTVQDITPRKRTEEALRESEGRFRQFGEAASDVLWIRDAETLAFEYLSPAFGAVYGLSREEALGGDRVSSWLDAIHPEDRVKVLVNLRHVRSGERIQYTFRVWHRSGGADGGLRHVRSTTFPLLDISGRVQRIAGISRDVTEEVELQERLEVMVAELQHRTRNLLGVVRSLATKTIAGSTSLADFRARFRDRLDALARVNGLLSRLEEGGRVTFEELLGAELFAHGAPQSSSGGTTQVSLNGPPGVRLRSSTVQTFALALHELATNAVKYGALSRPEGRLEVSWDLIPGQAGELRLRVEWSERGVPMPAAQADEGSEVETPASRRRGFGRDLIERILPVQLKAETSYDLTSGGLRCTITLPVSKTTDRDTPSLKHADS